MSKFKPIEWRPIEWGLIKFYLIEWRSIQLGLIERWLIINIMLFMEWIQHPGYILTEVNETRTRWVGVNCAMWVNWTKALNNCLKINWAMTIYCIYVYSWSSLLSGVFKPSSIRQAGNNWWVVVNWAPEDQLRKGHRFIPH